ncbi:aldo/keto reductase [Herbiconiux sp. P17]|uniref:aldo/keto reductase n=1 Tax=Herbiconiux wuyangfengii TaxID=3342794 RepID=UPI0035B6C895
MSALPARRIGDLEVSCLGMGAMTLTQTPDSDVASGMRAVRAALDAGVTLFDTADSYGPSGEMGVNERALVAALREAGRDAASVVVSTKGGHTRAENASWWLDGSPEHLAAAARASLGRLGLEALPLYHLHRPDPRVPFAESLGALKQLVDDGIAVRLGVSNVDEQQFAQAVAVLGPLLVSVQNEYSPVTRGSGPVIWACEEAGIAFLAWGPLGGMRAAKELGGSAAAFAEVARARGMSPQRIAIAWLLASSLAVIPIPGASRPESIRDSAAAAELVLDDAELRLLNGTSG